MVRLATENLAGLPELKQGQDDIRAWDNPIKPTGHLCVLRGNLAPGGAVEKRREEGSALDAGLEEDRLVVLAVAGVALEKLGELPQKRMGNPVSTGVGVEHERSTALPLGEEPVGQNLRALLDASAHGRIPGLLCVGRSSPTLYLTAPRDERELRAVR